MVAAVSEVREDRSSRSDMQLLIAYGRRNWWLILACVIAAILLGAAYLAVKKPAYDATAVLLIQPQTPDTGNGTPTAAPATPELVRSQLEILKSQQVLDQVVGKLQLAKDPAFTREVSANASAPRRAAAARDELSKRLDADNDGRSYTINLSAKAADPDKAAAIANTTANAYIQVQRNEKVKLLERTQQALDRRLSDLRNQTFAAELAAENYRQRAQLYPLSSVPEDSESYAAATPASREIIEMSKEHASLAAQRAQAQAKYAVQQRAIARGRGADTPEVLNSSVISDLRTREAQVAQREQELLARYRPDHPLIQPVEAELRAIRSNIASEINRIHASVASQAQASAQAYQQGDAFMGRLEQRRSRDLAASTQLNELQREAKIKRQTYEDYAEQAQRATQRVELQLPDVLLISPASPPLRSSGPKPAIVLLIAALAGLVIGLALGLLRSMMAERNVRVTERETVRP